MPDKPIKPPGSITEPADTRNERIAEVSNVNRSISEMQRKINQQLDESQASIGEYEGIEDVQNSMVKVLSSLNETVGTIGHGFAKIATDASRASTDALKQYGKAISEDISLNKRNIVATALAQSSPVFGYFAAKFVETDIFKSATQRMKSNISDALGGVTSKFKEGFGGIIGRARTKAEKEKPIKRTIPKAEEIPKMQTGGYVEKEGLARLHPAEVVVPIEKILSRIDESIDISRELALITRRTQLNALAKMGTYVKSVEKLERVGIFKGFMRAMRQVQTQYQEPSDVRQLRALLAIQDALGAQVGTWQQVWQKMLVEHPYFRNIAFAMKGISSVFGLPLKFVYGVFKSRGGYQAHLSKDRNPMKAMVENIGLVYTEGMWRLDNIALFTKATAEATRDLTSALTGKKYPPLEGVPTGVWSFANLATRLAALMTGRKRPGQRKALRGLYGGVSSAKGFGSPFLPKDIEMEATRITALPVAEIHLEHFTKSAEKYMIENKKSQKKLLGYTSNMSDVVEGEFEVIKTMNRREKRKTIFGLFGGALGGIKSLLGGGLTAILPMITGTILPWITGVFSKVWTKLIPMLSVGLKGILANPAMWGSVSAAILGTGIGKALDSLIGITSGRTAYLGRMETMANKMASEQAMITQERYTRARGGGEKGFMSAEALKISAQLAKYQTERERGAGWFGSRKIFEIQTGQRQFMEAHMDEYLKYGPMQLDMLRAEWLKGYKSTATLKEGHLYGKEREAAFLKYVRAKGKLRSEEEMKSAYGSYSGAYYNKFGVMDRAGGVWKDTKEFAKDVTDIARARTMAIEKAIEKEAKNIVKGTRELGAGMTSAVTQATNVVTTSIQNNSSTINKASQRVRDVFSEYEHAVIKGDYMMEGF
ncbi:MAG: hypothetical protein ACFFG0_02015 [Candidatus Thorarchaeota archaeon]